MVSGLPVSCFGPAVRRPEQRRILGLAGDARRIDIGQYKAFQVVPHRDFPALAALFLEPQHVLLAVVLEIAQPQLGDRPGPAGGIGQRGEDRPVPQARRTIAALVFT